jgi:kanamycin nucleotidyltransferase
MWNGPQPQSRAERLQVVDRIVEDLHRTYGNDLRAMALYGSLSRGTDGDYSDIELLCILTTPGTDFSREWVYGANKAEIDFYGEDVMRARAVQVDSRWSLRQGELINNRPIFGDLAFFDELRALVMSPPKASFDQVVVEMVIGECYEWMGKLRNGIARNQLSFLPLTTCNYTLHVALMAALLHRHIYSTSSVLLQEVLALPDLPSGYADLVGLVTTGMLHDPVQIAAVLEATWQGLEPWLRQHGIEFDEHNAWPWAAG